MTIGKQSNSEKRLKFSRLRISTSALQKYFKKVEDAGANEAYYMEGYEDIVFMSYSEDGEDFITILDNVNSIPKLSLVAGQICFAVWMNTDGCSLLQAVKMTATATTRSPARSVGRKCEYEGGNYAKKNR